MPRLKLALLRSLLTVLPVCAQNNPARPGGRNPFAGNQQAVTDGQEIYNRVCTACHGYDGDSGERAPGLGASGRRYLRVSDQDLFDAIEKGIPGTQMPPSGLAESDAWKVTAYIRGLRGTAIDTPAKGNVEHGEQVYWGKGGCSECHMLRGKGGLLGPDLLNVAGRRKLYAIRDALTKPEHRFTPDGGRHEVNLAPLQNYQAVRVVTRGGETVRGVLKNEDSFSLQMFGTDNELHLFLRDELREVIYEQKSLMPTDYDKRLTAGEFQDLLAFLTRQASVRAPARATAIDQ